MVWLAPQYCPGSVQLLQEDYAGYLGPEKAR